MTRRTCIHCLLGILFLNPYLALATLCCCISDSTTTDHQKASSSCCRAETRLKPRPPAHSSSCCWSKWTTLTCCQHSRTVQLLLLPIGNRYCRCQAKRPSCCMTRHSLLHGIGGRVEQLAARQTSPPRHTAGHTASDQTFQLHVVRHGTISLSCCSRTSRYYTTTSQAAASTLLPMTVEFMTSSFISVTAAP